MELAPKMQVFASNTANTLERYSDLQQNWLKRHVAAPVISFTAAETLAIVGMAYHTLAVIIQTLRTTAQALRLPIKDAMTRQQIFAEHVSPLGSAIKSALVTPLVSVSTKERAAIIRNTSSTIFSNTQNSTLDRTKQFISKHRQPLMIVGAVALAGIVIYGGTKVFASSEEPSGTPDPKPIPDPEPISRPPITQEELDRKARETLEAKQRELEERRFLKQEATRFSGLWDQAKTTITSLEGKCWGEPGIRLICSLTDEIPDNKPVKARIYSTYQDALQYDYSNLGDCKTVVDKYPQLPKACAIFTDTLLGPLTMEDSQLTLAKKAHRVLNTGGTLWCDDTLQILKDLAWDKLDPSCKKLGNTNTTSPALVCTGAAVREIGQCLPGKMPKEKQGEIDGLYQWIRSAIPQIRNTVCDSSSKVWGYFEWNKDTGVHIHDPICTSADQYSLFQEQNNRKKPL